MKNSQRGFVIPILVGIITLLILTGCIYIYNDNKSQNPVVVNANSSPRVAVDLVPLTSVVGTPKVVVVSKSFPTIAPSQSFITVYSPDAQDTWLNGSQQFIRWTSTGNLASEPVDIFLERKTPTDNKFWNIGTIATDQTGTGSYLWKVSPKDTTGKIIANSQYKILVGRGLSKGKGVSGESDGSFLIVSPIVEISSQPYINLSSPNNSQWKRHSVQTIEWTSNGIGNVSISLRMPCPDGYSCDTFHAYNGNFNIAKDISNTGDYIWNVGQTIECGAGDDDYCSVPNTAYELEICVVGQNICDMKMVTITN